MSSYETSGEWRATSDEKIQKRQRLRSPLFHWSLATRHSRLVLLLAMAAGGLGILTWRMIPDRSPAPPNAVAEDEVARLARQYHAAVPSASLQEILAHADVIPSHEHPLLGQAAPDFELADHESKLWKLSELRRENLCSPIRKGTQPTNAHVVLIFYYGYYCDHCVRQLFDVHRDLALFGELGARVVAVSADPPDSTRQRFEKYGQFGFKVLSDPGNKTAQAYQVFRGDLPRHATFLIDRNGTILWANVGDAPFRRNPALLYQLAKMEGRLIGGLSRE
jgi:peroxiredoxin